MNIFYLIFNIQNFISNSVGSFICMVIMLFIIIYLLYNTNKNFISNNDCNIINIQDSTIQQSLIYNVNNVKYTKTLLPTNNNGTLTYTFPEGKCTLFYNSANPDEYALNKNPNTILRTIAFILCIILILWICFVVFLQSKIYNNIQGTLDSIEGTTN